ncbi:MAG: hypothetical protein ACYCYP_13990 [Leptospirales bacterium]
MGKLIKELALAGWFNQSVYTVRRNRTAAPHRHPPYKKVGSSVLYDVDEVQRWLDAQTVNRQDDSTAPVKPEPTKQTHRGAPSKAERIKKARNADK